MHGTHVIGLQGQYRDSLIDVGGEVLYDGGWCANRIVNSCHRLLAALMKGQVDMDGILYLAIGEGLPTWDSAAPTSPASVDRLAYEWHRQVILPEQIEFLDQDEQPTEEPTDQLRLTMRLDGDELISSGYQSLREFGLFGGDATTDANSGYLINYVIHPRIDLTPLTTLNRELHLRFGGTTD